MAQARIFTCHHTLTPLSQGPPPSQRVFSNELCPDCQESRRQVPGAMELANKHRMETINLYAQREVFLLRSLAALSHPFPNDSEIQISSQIQGYSRAPNHCPQTRNNQTRVELSSCRQQLIALLNNSRPIDKQEHYASLRNSVVEAIKIAKQNVDILKATEQFVKRRFSVTTREGRAYAIELERRMGRLERVERRLSEVERGLCR